MDRPTVEDNTRFDRAAFEKLFESQMNAAPAGK
jgi:hypothetical protein